MRAQQPHWLIELLARLCKQAGMGTYRTNSTFDAQDEHGRRIKVRIDTEEDSRSVQLQAD